MSFHTAGGARPIRPVIPKLLGADVELGNYVEGVNVPEGSGCLASRLLLARIHGVPQYASYGGSCQPSWSGRFGWSDAFGSASNRAGNAKPAPAGGEFSRSPDSSPPQFFPGPTTAPGESPAGGNGGSAATDDKPGGHGQPAAGWTQFYDTSAQGYWPEETAYAAYAAGGVQHSGHSPGGGPSGESGNLQDWGRKFLAANGGCCYIDLWHLELCIPEVRSAFDYLAALHAMLRVARQAMFDANAELAAGRRVQVLANNSDGLGNSYGGHLNCLLSRRAWNDIFCHFSSAALGYLASFQVSSLVFAGQGKVGSENGRRWVPYQLSQRADFFESVVDYQTTVNRPLVNSRDEALCGAGRGARPARGGRPDYARLHCIFYDTNLCHVANVLKAGTMQMVLAMIEAGWADSRLLLARPLEAVGQVSHDLTLRTKLEMADGRRLTAVELQMCFLEQMQEFHQRGGFAGAVPRAAELLALYAQTLEKLRKGELDALMGELDWVLKLRLLQRARARLPGLRWDSAQMKLLDHRYSSLDPEEGLYWVAERANLVRRLVSPGRIERFVHQPPPDTRAFARAMLLRSVPAENFSRVDWDSIGFRLKGRRNWWTYRTLEMADPLAMTRAQTGHLFAARLPLERLLDALEDVAWARDSRSRSPAARSPFDTPQAGCPSPADHAKPAGQAAPRADDTPHSSCQSSQSDSSKREGKSDGPAATRTTARPPGRRPPGR